MSELTELTTEEFERLNSCQTEEAWSEACLAVKAARDGRYPADWYSKMLGSGLMKEIFERFGKKAEFGVEQLVSCAPAYGGPPP